MFPSRESVELMTRAANSLTRLVAWMTAALVLFVLCVWSHAGVESYGPQAELNRKLIENQGEMTVLLQQIHDDSIRTQEILNEMRKERGP